MEKKITISYLLRCGFSFINSKENEWYFTKIHTAYDYELDGEVDYKIIINLIKNKWFLGEKQIKNLKDLEHFSLIEEEKCGFVYIIKSELGYKIGKSKNLDSRTKIFNVKMPFKWHYERIYVLRDYSYFEKFFHDCLNYKHINGEWFDINEYDLSVIDKFIQLVPMCP